MSGIPSRRGVIQEHLLVLENPYIVMASKVPTQSGTVCLWLQLISGKTQEGKQESFTVHSSISPPSSSNILHPANWKQQAVKCACIDLVKQDSGCCFPNSVETVQSKLCREIHPGKIGIVSEWEVFFCLIFEFCIGRGVLTIFLMEMGRVA